jgi:hypothetical protein
MAVSGSIVTILLVGQVAGWEFAAVDSGRWVPITVGVGIGVERGDDAFVRGSVAIVIDLITDFNDAGVDGGVVVIAVCRARVSVRVGVNSKGH